MFLLFHFEFHLILCFQIDCADAEGRIKLQYYVSGKGTVAGSQYSVVASSSQERLTTGKALSPQTSLSSPLSVVAELLP